MVTKTAAQSIRHCIGAGRGAFSCDIIIAALEGLFEEDTAVRPECAPREWISQRPIIAIGESNHHSRQEIARQQLLETVPPIFSGIVRRILFSVRGDAVPRARIVVPAGRHVRGAVLGCVRKRCADDGADRAAGHRRKREDSIAKIPVARVLQAEINERSNDRCSLKCGATCTASTGDDNRAGAGLVATVGSLPARHGFRKGNFKVFADDF